jgi:hypothetical protein
MPAMTLDNIFKFRNGPMVLFLSFEEKRGIRKSNFETPYFVGFADLEKSAPLLFDLPKGLRSFCSKIAL